MTPDPTETTESTWPPPVTGVHHVRIPVTDAWVSRDWYSTRFGFDPVADLESVDGLVGVVLRHGSGLVLGLHQDPDRASCMRGFCLLGLTVPDLASLDAWIETLDGAGVDRSEVQRGHLGRYIEIPDPDGILLRLHTPELVETDDA